MTGGGVSEVYRRWLAWDVGNRQSLNSYWAEVARADRELRDVCTTVECVLGGDTVIRAAVKPMVTTSSLSGERVQYLPLLQEEPALGEGIELGQQRAAARSVQVTMREAGVDVAGMLARGRVLTGRAEIALQVDGQDHALRWVMLRGKVEDVEFSDTDRLVTLTIVDDRTATTKLPEHSIDTTRWPLAQDTAIGERYALVYNGATGLPCHRVLDDFGTTGLKWVACNALNGPWTVAATYVNGEEAAGVAHTPISSSVAADGRGTPVQVLDASSTTGPWDENDSLNVDVTSTMRADVLKIAQELLTNYSVSGPSRVDAYRFGEARLALPSMVPYFAVSTSGGDTVDPLELVEAGLLRDYPSIHLLYSGRGVGPVVYDRRYRAGEGPVLTRGVYPLIEKRSEMREQPGRLHSSFELRYQNNIMRRSYGKVLTADPDTSPLCRAMTQMMEGLQPHEPLDAAYIHYDEDAAYVVSWWVQHNLPSYVVEWAAYPAALFEFRVGQNVRYADDRLDAFSEADATIEYIVRTAERGCLMGLRVWHPYWTRKVFA